MGYEEFRDSYVTTLVWSDGDDTVSALHGEPMGALFDEDSCHRINADTRRFYMACSSFWREHGWTDDEAGYDLALTRNEHGTGFWDRGRGDAGDALSMAAHVLGEVCIYTDSEGEKWTVE